MNYSRALVPLALLWACMGLAVLAGAALQLQQARLWLASTVWALAFVAGVVMGLVWRWRLRPWACAVLGVATVVLSFALTATRAQWRLDDALAPALEGQDLQVQGQVVSLPDQGLTGTRFDFRIDEALLQGQPVRAPSRVALAWYRGADEDALLGGPPPALQAGQRWQFTVRLRQPHGAANPHGFDVELWLFERGLRAQGYVRATVATPANMQGHGWGAPVHRLRQHLRDAIFLRVADAGMAGIVAALVVGDQAAINRADWDVFRATGVAHLMSISGLHVTMLAWLGAALVGWLWRRSARAMLTVPAPTAARWGGLLLALVYAALAGWGVPAQRTVAMLAAVVVLRTLALRWPLLAVLLAAAVFVTVLDPWALLQPGFWLSFVAVALLASSEPATLKARATGWPGQAQLVDALPSSQPTGGAREAWRKLGSLVGTGLRTQAVATVGLAPLSMVFFQQISLVGFAANLLAIPLITLVVTPLALMGALLPWLWSGAAVLLQGLMLLLQTMAAWPWAVWSAAAAPAWAVLLGLLAAALAVLPLPWRMRCLALPLMLPLLAPPVQWPPQGEFEVVVVDVGQGTSVLVRTRGHLLVYDAGPQYSAESDAGARLLLPLLRARGEREVHLLMLSHRDVDHTGGAAALLQALPVRSLASSLEPGHPLLSVAVPHTPCHAGQNWQWDGVRFEVLHPLAPDLPKTDGKPVTPNALSCVLRVSTASRSLLLTGDVEAAQEAALVERSAPEALASQLLVVPHHGSRTSSTSSFIRAVAPQQAVVQAAYRSRFGHPAPSVLARYEALGVAVLRSDQCGALVWPAGVPLQQATCQRSVGRRYWHHPSGL